MEAKRAGACPTTWIGRVGMGVGGYRTIDGGCAKKRKTEDGRGKGSEKRWTTMGMGMESGNGIGTVRMNEWKGRREGKVSK